MLAVFEGRFGRLKEERDNLRKAKEALELSQPEQVTASDDRMQVGQEELQDLKVTVSPASPSHVCGVMFPCTLTLSLSTIRACGRS